MHARRSRGPSQPQASTGPQLRVFPAAGGRWTLGQAIGSCGPYLPALFLVALRRTGDRVLAEERVVDAVVRTVADPTFDPSDGTSTWRRLAACLDEPAAAPRAASPPSGEPPSGEPPSGGAPMRRTGRSPVPSGSHRPRPCHGARRLDHPLGARMVVEADERRVLRGRVPAD